VASTTFNIADLFEQAVDEWPDRIYLIDPSTRRTYAQIEARANQLAHYLAAQGVGPGDHVGIYALNRAEWVETLFAVFKLRAVWININYRYVEDELRYLFDQANLKFLLVEEEWSERARQVAPDLPQLVYGPDYEAAIADQSTERDFPARSDDDIYILFTGGTTGMPKGVVWRHKDVVMALGGGMDVRTGEKLADPTGYLPKGANNPVISFPLPPLMHGASQWSVMSQSFIGATVVLRPTFDPYEVWRTIEAERVNSVFITGDAMARPMLDAYEALVADGRTPDTSSLFMVGSSAVLFSQHSKDRFLDLLPNLILGDATGSSESGGTGYSVVSKGTKMKGGPTVTPIRDTVVLDDQLNLVQPGSGITGQLARRGNLPIGYLNDEAKTAATFVTAPDGVRYVLTGDMATVEADGSITMFGRGSVCINTGGEKVFPEEVENALKSHPDVDDAVVVGVPDDLWGERVTAVVSAKPDRTLSLDELQTHCRQHVAGYKVPRGLVVVDKVVRSPAGKSDYRWAKTVAMEDQP